MALLSSFNYYYVVPGTPKEQSFVDETFAGMLYDHYSFLLPLTSPDYSPISVTTDGMAPYSLNYPFSPMFMPPSLLSGPVDSSPLPRMEGCVAQPDPPSPPALIGDEFLVPKETAASMLPPSFTPHRSSPSNKKEPSASSRYKCETCNKCFTRPYNLKSHLRTHTNERPFVCSAKGCSWKFARPHDLRRHELLHSGKKPHKCSVCNKRFARRDALRRHWKVERECGELIEKWLTENRSISR